MLLIRNRQARLQRLDRLLQRDRDLRRLGCVEFPSNGACIRRVHQPEGDCAVAVEPKGLVVRARILINSRFCCCIRERLAPIDRVARDVAAAMRTVRVVIHIAGHLGSKPAVSSLPTRGVPRDCALHARGFAVARGYTSSQVPPLRWFACVARPRRKPDARDILHVFCCLVDWRRQSWWHQRGQRTGCSTSSAVDDVQSNS